MQKRAYSKMAFPVLNNIYLHSILDFWMEEVVNEIQSGIWESSVTRTISSLQTLIEYILHFKKGTSILLNQVLYIHKAVFFILALLYGGR